MTESQALVLIAILVLINLAFFLRCVALEKSLKNIQRLNLKLIEERVSNEVKNRSLRGPDKQETNQVGAETR